MMNPSFWSVDNNNKAGDKHVVIPLTPAHNLSWPLAGADQFCASLSMSHNSVELPSSPAHVLRRLSALEDPPSSPAITPSHPVIPVVPITCTQLLQLQTSHLNSFSASPLDSPTNPAEPWEKRMLTSLRAELTDVRIRGRIIGLSKSKCLKIANYILVDTALLWQQHTVERGSVVACLIERVGSDRASGLVKFVLNNILSLSRDKGGCVAVPRVLQHAGRAERMVALETLRADPEVAVDEYANFVLQYFVQGGSGEYGLSTTEEISVGPTAEEVCSELIHRELSNSATIIKWASSKCGSRVVDTVIRQAGEQDARTLLQTIFADENVVRSIGEHEFGHYNLKRAFEILLEGRLKTAPDQTVLLRQYYEIAEPLLKSSRFSRWVLRRVKEHLNITDALRHLLFLQQKANANMNNSH